MDRPIAYFITPHGFGHASRASAVMSALQEIIPDLRFEVFTEVPEWVFRDSVGPAVNYHPLKTDVGLVQETPFQADLAETIQQLSHLIPYRDEVVNDLAGQIKDLACEMILCDVSTLGIAAAKAAGLPSVLIENFTWDWIYEGYLEEEHRFLPYTQFIMDWVKQVDTLIQTEPLCERRPEAAMIVPPISRKPKNDRAVVRARLGIPLDSKAVLITTGGIQGEFPFLHRLAELEDIYFILPGASDIFQLQGNLILMPHHSDFFHPDLTIACNAVIGKAGYSTIAEVYHAGVPFGYVIRNNFRESGVLARFIEREMLGFSITEEEYPAGDWVNQVPELLAKPKIKRQSPNGADLVAEFVLSKLGER